MNRPMSKPDNTPPKDIRAEEANDGDRARLEYLSPGSTLSEFDLTDASNLLGRANDCAVRLTHDPKISRHHAEILEQDGRWFVRDLDSKNGTFLNGSMVVHSPLRDGDHLTVGSVDLLFTFPSGVTHPHLRWSSSVPSRGGGRSYGLGELPCKIGSSPDNDISLPKAKALAPHHATIGMENGNWYVQALEGASRVSVNGKPVDKEQLHDGDEVCFGQERFRFAITAMELSRAKHDRAPVDQQLDDRLTNCRLVSVSAIRTLGDMDFPQPQPHFWGERGSIRRRMFTALAGFVIGVITGLAWVRIVAGTLVAGSWSDQLRNLSVLSLVSGTAVAILTMIHDVARRMVLNPYFRAQRRLLLSATHRKLRRVGARLKRQLESEPNRGKCLSEQTGLRVLESIMMKESYTDPDARESAEESSDPAMLNNFGVALARAHYLTKSIAAFESASRLEPNRFTFFANLGRAQRRSGRPTEAIRSLEQAEQLDPQNSAILQSLGLAHFHAGNVKEARAIFCRGLENSPGAGDLSNNLGVAHHLQGELVSSLRLFRAALRSEPGSAVAASNLGMEYMFLGEFGAGTSELTKAHRISRNQLAVQNNLGVAQYIAGSVEEADRMVSQILNAAGAPSFDALYNLGTMRWLQGDCKAAIQHLEHAVRRKPDSVAARINLGCALFDSDQIQRAALVFEGAVRQDPKSPAALTNLGLALVRLGRLEDGQPYLEKAFSICSEPLVVRFNLAYLKHLQGNAEEAIGLYEQLLQNDSRIPEIHANMGLCYYFLGGNLDLAIHSLQQALALSPQLHTVPFSLARVLCDKGDLAQALKYLELAHKDEPANPDVYRDLGLVYYQLQQYDPAVQAFVRTVQLSPHDAADQNNLALVYAKKGKHQEAIYHFKRALEFDPDDVVSRGNLGLSYYLSGNADLAVKEWHQVSVLSPKYHAEREDVRHAAFDDARLGFTPFDWQARAINLHPLGMGLQYRLLTNDDDDYWQLELSDPDLAQVPELIRRIQRYDRALLSLRA